MVSDLSKTFSFQCLTTDLLVYYFPFQPIFHSGHQNNLLQLKSMSLPHFPMLLEEVRIIICLQGLRSCPPLPHTHSQDLLPVIAPNLGCLTSMSCLPCPLCLWCFCLSLYHSLALDWSHFWRKPPLASHTGSGPFSGHNSLFVSSIAVTRLHRISVACLSYLQDGPEPSPPCSQPINTGNIGLETNNPYQKSSNQDLQGTWQ